MVDWATFTATAKVTAFKEVVKFCIKILWNAISKDDKFNVKRSIIVVLVFGVGYLFYIIPDVLIFLSNVVTLKIDFSLYSFISSITTMASKNVHYHHLLKSLFLTFYLFLGCAITAFIFWLKTAKYEEGYNEMVKLKRFASAVSLIGGIRPINDDGKAELKARVENAIEGSSTINFMLINGSSIFSSPDDPILKGIENCKGKSIKILLLDPLSQFATDRAKSMTNAIGTDGTEAVQRYIDDFKNTLLKVTTLKKGEWGKSNSIDLRCHCSRPYFRLYVFDEDAFIQTYANAYDGHKSPVYHVRKDQDTHYNSLYSVASDMFNFFWDRGFSYDAPASIKGVLPIYLAKMHNIPVDAHISDLDALRTKIVENSKQKLEL